MLILCKANAPGRINIDKQHNIPREGQKDKMKRLDRSGLPNSSAAFLFVLRRNPSLLLFFRAVQQEDRPQDQKDAHELRKVAGFPVGG